MVLASIIILSIIVCVILTIEHFCINKKDNWLEHKSW